MQKSTNRCHEKKKYATEENMRRGKQKPEANVKSRYKRIKQKIKSEVGKKAKRN